MKTLALLTLLFAVSVFANAETEPPVHLFILSGQSNMQGMAPLQPWADVEAGAVGRKRKFLSVVTHRNWSQRI